MASNVLIVARVSSVAIIRELILAAVQHRLSSCCGVRNLAYRYGSYGPARIGSPANEMRLRLLTQDDIVIHYINDKCSLTKFPAAVDTVSKVPATPDPSFKIALNALCHHHSPVLTSGMISNRCRTHRRTPIRPRSRRRSKSNVNGVRRILLL